MSKPTLLLTYLVLLSILLLINLESHVTMFQIFKAILVLSLSTFIPGYVFILLFQERHQEHPNMLIISIAMSICIVMLSGVALYLIGFNIDPTNILNPVWFVLSIITITLFLYKKPPKKPKKRKILGIDMVFYVNLALILLFFIVLSYISVSPSLPRGFVDVYWEFINVENPWPTDTALCKDMKCSLSGISKIREIQIGHSNYDILFMDINQPEKYDSICVDVNDNDIYCEHAEGPFSPSETFLIGGSTYSYRFLGEESIVIFFYPQKLIGRTVFTISYNIKSYYLDAKKYDVVLTVNNNIVSKQEIFLRPLERRTIEEEITILPIQREHKVEVIATPEGGKPVLTNLKIPYLPQ
ncbi:MAG: hypothetical protein GF368_02975 [Candidatus Aenigmarchaeota archaeon]|nr:hypothetical protein [Candidatus Aenigmarchaeota archaeon]